MSLIQYFCILKSKPFRCVLALARLIFCIKNRLEQLPKEAAKGFIFMIIDYKELSDQALKGVAEAYVASHLSDVDDQLKFSDWVEEVIKKVQKGELLVEFSKVDESVTLKSPEEVELVGSVLRSFDTSSG